MIESSWKFENHSSPVHYRLIGVEMPPDVLTELGTDRFIQLKQIHSNRVLEVNSSHPTMKSEADAMVTCDPTCGLVIRTADCLPILLASPGDGKIIKAAIHAGWRGFAGGIIYNTLDKMEKLGADFSKLQMTIGPAISINSFEVGTEVAKSFDVAGIQIVSKPHKTASKIYLDLPQMAVLEILKWGVKSSQVNIHSICTFQDQNWNSYRRNQNCGRNHAIIW